MTRSLNAFGLVALAILIVAGTIFVLFREGPPKLVINEFMGDNATCCPDISSGTNEFDDWIEIHNYGTVPVNIGGMYFSQHKSKPTAHKIPDTQPELTTIPPGGFLLLWADGSPEQGVLHLKFRLDQDGEFLGFFDQHGRTIDTHSFRNLSPDVSVGRRPDGKNEWVEFNSPTPGRSNQ